MNKIISQRNLIWEHKMYLEGDEIISEKPLPKRWFELGIVKVIGDDVIAKKCAIEVAKNSELLGENVILKTDAINEDVVVIEEHKKRGRKPKDKDTDE